MNVSRGNRNITRYLCVAACLDEDFSDRVIAELGDNDLRAVAASPDVDLRPVLLHAVAARRQHQRRDAALAVIWILTLLASPLWALVSALTLAFVSIISRHTLASARVPYLVMGPGWRGALRSLGALSAGLALLAVASLIVTPQLTANLWLDWVDGAFPGGPLVAPLAWLAMYGIVLYYRLQDRAVVVGKAGPRVTRYLSLKKLSAYYPPLAKRLDAIDSYQQGNVTVYSDVPFIGFGEHLQPWSFALPLLPKKSSGLDLNGQQGEVVLFSVLDVIDQVKKRLTRIAQDNDASVNGHDLMPGLLLEERVFVNGKALNGNSRLLPRRDEAPVSNLSASELSLIALSPTGAPRHRLCVHVSFWGGRVTASTFVHFSTLGDTLYVKCDRSVLGPVDYVYRVMDRLSTNVLTVRHVLYHLAEAAYFLFPQAFSSPGRVLRLAFSRAWSDRRRARIHAVARKDLAFDYGARTSIREMVDSTHYTDNFQAWDADKHLKIVEQNLMAAILDFLDDHGVDTTDFRNSQMMFLFNNSVLQAGAHNVMQNMSAGAGSTATQHAMAGRR